MQVTFFKTPSLNNEINKTFYNETPKEIGIYDVSDILNPTLLLDKSLIDFNYCYIPNFKRFYFIDRMEILDGNRYKAFLHVDVLSTYKSTFQNTLCHIERSTNNGNYYFTDNYTPILSKRKQFIKNFQYSVIDGKIDSNNVNSNTYNTVLTITGKRGENLT